MRDGTVQADRYADAVDAGAESAATGAAAFTRPQAAAGAASNTGAVSVAERIGDGIGEWIA